MQWPANTKSLRNFFTRVEAQLFLGAGGTFAILLGIFYPGYMSADSIHQAHQALGTMPLTDWHPVSMTLAWRVLIHLTGHISSFVIAQLMLLVGALYGLSLYIYKTTRRKYWAFGIYIIVFLPFVLSIAGVVWKDVSMAFAMLLASVLFLLTGSYIRESWAKWICIVSGSLLLIYAGTLRYNALLAAIPLLILVPQLALEKVTSQVRTLVLSGGIGAIILAMYVLGANSQHTYPVTAVMIDDIIHISPNIGSTVNQSMYKHIRQVCNTSTTEIMNSYVLCTNEYERSLILKNHNQVIGDWFVTLVQHPLGYMRYRMAVFAVFLFPEPSRLYVYQDGVIDNDLGIASAPYISRAVGAYVNGLARVNFVFLFQPWFWLSVLCVILYYAHRKSTSTEKRLMVAVAMSGLLYGVPYAAVAVATDYRYIYWPVLAALFCVCVLAISHPYSIIELKKRQ